MKEANKTIQVLNRTYELQPHPEKTVVEVFGTNYEIYEHESNFHIYRIDADNLAICCGDSVNSFIASIELAEIFERLVIYALNTGLVSELDMIRFYLNGWQSSPPHKIDL